MADVPWSSFVGGLSADTISGAEKVPMLDTDGSTAKHITPALISAYVIDQIVGAAAITSLGDTHQFPVFTSGDDEKIITGANLSAWIFDEIEAATLGTSIVSGDHLVYSDGGVLKRITIDNVLSYINTTNGTLGAQVDALSTATLADTDEYLVEQGGTALKATFSAIAARVHDQISTYTAALSAVTTPADADKLYILQGATAKYCTLTVLANTYLAAELNLENLQWPTSTTTPSAAGDKLLMERSGTISEVDIDTLVTYFATGLQAGVLDFSGLSSAVPNAADEFVVDDSGTPKSITLSALETKLWTDFATYVAALTENTTVTASDKLYVIQSGTPKWVDPDALGTYLGVGTGDVSGPVTTTEDKVPQWDSTSKLLKDGLTVVTTVRDAGQALDTAIPTEQAVRESLASAAFDELDIDGATEIGDDLAGTDLFLVDDGANGTNRSSAISRIKTYVEKAGTWDNIYIDANRFKAPSTNGAASGSKEYATNDINLEYFAFDGGATEEKIQFKHVMPEAWDRGAIKVRFYWSSATGSTAGDTVEWGVKALALSNNDAIDASFGAAETISDTLLANDGDDMQVTIATEITVGGSPQLADMIVFEVYRNTDGTDDMTEDAWLFGVEIQYQRTREVSTWSPAASSSPSSSPSSSVSSSPSSSVSSSPSSSPSSSASSSPSSSPSAT